jgi:hypothetical protein
LIGLGPQHIGKPALQSLIALELHLDLAEEGFGDRAGVGEYADGQLGIGENVLDRLGEGDDRDL